MTNQAMFPPSQNDLNDFTKELKRRCLHAGNGQEGRGEVLVKMRNGDYVKAMYREANEDWGTSHGFYGNNYDRSWYANGRSHKSSDFDIVEL